MNSAITKEQFPRTKAFIQEFWQLMKDFRNPQDSDWAKLIERTQEIGGKYCEDDVVLSGTLVGFINALEEEARSKNGIYK